MILETLHHHCFTMLASCFTDWFSVCCLCVFAQETLLGHGQRMLLSDLKFSTVMQIYFYMLILSISQSLASESSRLEDGQANLPIWISS